MPKTLSWYDKKDELTLADIIMAIRKSIWISDLIANADQQSSFSSENHVR
ncbi:MAG: hypothetical protein ACHP65_08165 [Legionellales bacterium]